MKDKQTVQRAHLFQEKPWYQSQTKTILSIFLDIIADIFQYFPKKIRKIMVKNIDNFGLFLIRLFRISPFTNQPYHFIKGPGIENEKIHIAYQGNLPSFMFFLKRLFPDTNQMKITTLVSNNKNKEKIRDLKKQANMIVIEKDYFLRGFYQKKGYLVIPENISFLLPTSQPIDEIISSCSKSIQQDIKKAKNIGYQSDITGSIHQFKKFYDTMYLPYATWRYKEMGKIVSYGAMRHYALRGSNILIVTLDDEQIFGGILDIEKQRITTQYSGVKEGKYDHIHNGIIALSYYFLLEIAKEANIKSINFGTSSPFLLDGLCQYKMKWNMKIVRTNPVFSTIFAVKINDKSESLLDFFQKNPFIYYNKEKLSAAVYSTDSEKDEIKKREMIKHNSLKGIELTLFHSLQEL